jgi:hypothetical protein
MRLVIILLLLVVLPTALLSVLAGRSIQAREVILQNRLELDGLRLIDDVRSGLRLQLQIDADHVSDAFRETFLAGMNIERGSELLSPHLADCITVKHPYLFMNPWGFVFPNVPDTTSENALFGDVLLRQKLIDMLARTGQNQHRKITIHVENRVYCFSPMMDFSGLYSGFEVDVSAAMDRLETLIAECSTEDILLKATPLSTFESDSDVANDVSISDSFSSSTISPAPVISTDDSAGVLASRPLASPIGYNRV